MARGNTFDLYVLDVSAKWSKYQNDKADGKTPSTAVNQPTQEELLAMIKRTKGEL